MSTAVVLGAAAAPAAVITVGSASGPPGAAVTVGVSLQTEGVAVLATQNRIDFGRDAAIAAREDGEPDCAVNPAIDKQATGFRFLPLECDPAVDCESVRAFVIAFDNLAPIPDGSLLYSCRVQIAAAAAVGSRFPLANAEAASSATGGVLVPTTGVDGFVDVAVPSEPVARIAAGTAGGAPGELVEVAVTLELLTDPPAAVVATQNDLSFGPQTPIAAALPGGGPACAVNPAIDKAATSFAFLPDDCDPGGDCTGIRAVVISAGNTAPIPAGATLYTCEILIADEAAPGVYPLLVSNPAGADGSGEELAAIGADGSVTVTEAPPPCVGDCNGDGMVMINELLVGVNISAEAAPLEACAGLDADASGAVQINELILAVNNALSGCPA